MVAGGHHGGGHLSNTHGDRLSLGGHQHHLVANLDVVREAQKTGEHQLGSITDGVHSGVLHHNALVLQQKDFQWTHHTAEIGVALSVLIAPLSIQHVVHGHHAVVLRDVSRTHATKLLHVTTRTQQQTEMHAERTDVRTSLTAHPEHSQIAGRIVLNQLAVVDRTNTQLALDGSDERRTLEESSGKLLQSLL